MSKRVQASIDAVALSSEHFNTIICDNVVEGRCSSVSGDGGQQVQIPIRLVGTTFDGLILDTNFWQSTVTNDGTVTVSGEAELNTNTTANGTAKLTSVRRGRFIVGTPLRFSTVCEWRTVGSVDNIRRIGAYDVNNGFFFQLDGTTFSIGIRTNRSGSPVDTLVSSGSFNGDLPDYTINTARNKCVIEYGVSSAVFIINNVKIHTLPLTHENSPTTFVYPITIENINDNDSIIDNEFHVVGATIYRLGELLTNSTYKYIAGASTTICKYTAGILHRLINNDNAGSCIVYDNTAGSGTIIANLDLTKVLGSIDFDAPFNNGLTIVTTGTSTKVTLTYE